MFNKVLIANRGEIALRIQRACRELGLETVAVHSEADADARYVRLADEALCIGPAAPGQSYLNRAAILFAAHVSGAQAIHPGYGFLSENADFAAQVEAAGMAFIGPEPDSIRTMGDKVAAKRAMRAAGVPCVPGPDGGLPDDPTEILRVADEIGYPVIVKAAGGGGGRGMRVVPGPEQLLEAVSVTREEARRAFGKPELYVEKFLEHPRHVEIQVLCDTHGNALWLGSRDCSLQRRHQKVLEEAPAPGIDPELIRQVGERCVEACRQTNYRGAGTFEFLFENGQFYFIEMNTRLQVEHPVTEMTSGIDIVREQIRIAQGHALTLRQSDLRTLGHSLECRINAEDPFSFVPCPGKISVWELPGGNGVRVDSHMSGGAVVPPYYDSLIAKVITHGATREEALARMRIALSEMRIEGIRTNVPLHRAMLEDEGFCDGGVDIHHLERWLAKRKQT
ncbi:acetyl-CoA carboxylase [Paraburkholderia caffeinilytica]|uniref:Biotin carboxylase n=1 Tax=Paraburkholderia caffeinilytica TaxID=1761016 RepID=A0ABQ1N9H1_9BURK|nr:acetyl-CoA carboxylase biotin carboxylase subunit [Paraburkholderia caffeinilytica]AXL48703.1 acetyl-CoA carboxylase [Paraburkholderia caffeinilytica]GGC62156.1 acetyl-CoA carboxylase biotin carboxylase subunit [Paraburkholderia caffeinilytica]CAB3798543.1 Biotin carboxylase [Paraburkholderia caffeinilytica]